MMSSEKSCPRLQCRGGQVAHKVVLCSRMSRAQCYNIFTIRGDKHPSWNKSLTLPQLGKNTDVHVFKGKTVNQLCAQWQLRMACVCLCIVHIHWCVRVPICSCVRRPGLGVSKACRRDRDSSRLTAAYHQTGCHLTRYQWPCIETLKDRKHIQRKARWQTNGLSRQNLLIMMFQLWPAMLLCSHWMQTELAEIAPKSLMLTLLTSVGGNRRTNIWNLMNRVLSLISWMPQMPKPRWQWATAHIQRIIHH